MVKLAANVSLLFTEHPFLDRFAPAAKAGFRGVELLFPYEWPVHEIRQRLDESHLELVLFNISPGDFAAGERGLAALKGREDEFEAETALALNYAEALGCCRLHAMAGLAQHGADRAVYVANLRRAARLARPLGVDILIEPINTRDIPGYFLTRTEDAREIIVEVNEPNLGLQLDLYHRHLMQGDVIGAIAEFAPLVRHYQCAGPPDRGEPDVGEVDFRDVFQRIDATGYQGWVGCEYKPRAGTVAGLAWREKLGVTGA